MVNGSNDSDGHNEYGDNDKERREALLPNEQKGKAPGMRCKDNINDDGGDNVHVANDACINDGDSDEKVEMRWVAKVRRQR